MKLNFCTLFSSNYLSRGIALYQSLLKHNKNFHLYVFAFDDITFNYFLKENLPHLTVISLDEFEDEELLRVKPNRKLGEYCWTCTSSTILYSINKYNLSNCTYLDADMMFFSDPKVLIDEMGEKSVLITEHRYTKEYDQSEESGIYCVQFVTFKNNEHGMKVLNWWRERCLEWCYAIAENGKFGDQKYLDDWTERFEGVHELQHLGGGIAPWNVQQYSFQIKKGDLIGTEKTTGNNFKAIFYHYHGVKYYYNDIVSFSHPAYLLSKNVQKLFYQPYIKTLNKIKESINLSDSSFDPNGSTENSPIQPYCLKSLFILYLKELKKSPKNIFGKSIKNKLKHHYFYFSKKL